MRHEQIEPASEPSAQLEALRNAAQGHVFDGVHYLKESVTRQTLIIGSGLAVGVETFNDGFDTSLWVTLPIYEAGVLAVTGAIYGGYRQAQKRIQARSLARHAKLQDQFSEPMDVLGNKHRARTIRWYGFDKGYHDDDFEPASTVDKFTCLVAASRATNIKSIAVSTNIFALEGTESILGQKKVLDGPSYLRQQRVGAVIDRFSDQRVVVLSIEQSEQIAEQLQSKSQSDVLAQLAAILEQYSNAHPVLDALRHAAKQEVPDYTCMNKLLRRAVESRYRDESSIILDRGADGTRLDRLRSHQQVVLSGDRVFTSSETVDRYGKSELSTQGYQSVIGAYGHQTLEEFVKFLQENHTKLTSEQVIAQVESGMWYALHHQKDSVKDMGNDNGSVSGGQAEGKARNVAVQERLAAEPPRVFPWLRKYGKGVDAETATLEYSRKHRMPKLIGILALGVGVQLASARAGNTLVNHMNNAYANAKAALPANHQTDADIRRYATKHNPMFAHILGGAEIIWKADAALSDAVVGWEADLGIPSNRPVLGSWADKRMAEYDQLHNKYTDQQGNADIGDAPGAAEDNTPIWNIAASGGANAKGYWTESVYSSLVLSQKASTPPYKDAGITFSEGQNFNYTNPDESQIKHLSLQNPSQLLKKEPLIKVSGDRTYLEMHDFTEVGADGIPVTDMQKAVDVPVVNGYTIAAAKVSLGNVVDGASTALATEAVQRADGTYTLLIPNTSAGGDQLFHVSYWLKPVSGPEVVPHAANKMILSNLEPLKPHSVSIGTALLGNALTAQGASTIWNALPDKPAGPMPADPLQLAKVIRETHTYSYTPYADAHTKRTRSLSAYPVVEQLRQMGVVAASLPESVCNLAATQELLMLRGQDVAGKPINVVTGFFQASNDQYLTGAESHMWDVNSQGDVIDATPTSSSVASQPIKKLQLAKSPGDTILHNLEIGGEAVGGLAMAGLSLAAARRGRRRLKSWRADTANSLLLPEASEDQERQHRNITLLQMLYFAPKTKHIDAKVLQKQATKQMNHELATRYELLPHVKVAKTMKLLHDRMRQGTIFLEREHIKDFQQFLRALDRSTVSQGSTAS